VVAQAILEAAVELHPTLLRIRELSLRIIADPKDRREVETATQAIDDLNSPAYLQTGMMKSRSRRRRRFTPLHFSHDGATRDYYAAARRAGLQRRGRKSKK